MDRKKIDYIISKRRSLAIRLVSSFILVVVIIVLAIVIPSVII